MRIFLSDASYSAATEDANAVTKHQANVSKNKRIIGTNKKKF